MKPTTKLVIAGMLLMNLTSVLAQPPGTKMWEFVASDRIRSSPAIGPDGTIYFSAENGDLYALNPEGALKWRLDLSAGSPSIGTNGIVYICSSGWLNAVDSKPSIAWRFRLDSDLTFNGLAAISPDGAIFSVAQGEKNRTDDADGSFDFDPRGELYSVSAAGVRNWRIRLNSFFSFPPVLGPNGMIYVGAANNRVHAYNEAGIPKWIVGLEENAASPAAVGPDGRLLFGTKERLYAISADGIIRWAFRTGQPIYSSPAIGADGTAYFGCDNHNFYALGADGKKIWEFATTQEIRSSPALGADGTIYFGGSDGIFYALDLSGKLRWKFQTLGAIQSSPNIAPDGTVYVGSDDRRLYAFKGSATLAKTSWPRFRGGRMQTARVFENGRPPSPGLFRIDSLAKTASGQWKITVTNRNDQQIQIEGSNDLINWSALPLPSRTLSPVQVVDDSTNRYSQRYYRARLVD